MMRMLALVGLAVGIVYVVLAGAVCAALLLQAVVSC